MNEHPYISYDRMPSLPQHFYRKNLNSCMANGDTEIYHLTGNSTFFIMLGSVAGWSSLAARRAHNPKVVGSNPAPATNACLCCRANISDSPLQKFKFTG